MTIGVICSLTSLAIVIIGHICSFAYIQGQNNNRLKNLEEKSKICDDTMKEISQIKADLSAIKASLEFIKGELKEK